MNHDTLRRNLVCWMVTAVVGHFVVGVLLPWCSGMAALEGYHLDVESYFWQGAAPAAARAQQLWWISLFGPTVQCMALWMGALVYMGYRYRSPFAWGALVAGVVLWAPQDIYISLQAKVWPHVWADSVAVATLLPPLLILWWIERQWQLTTQQSEVHKNKG